MRFAFTKGGTGQRPAIRSATVEILDDYDGAVHPGGPAQQRTLDALTISKISVGPMDNNAYLLICRSTGEALLIDAANEAERLMDLLGHGPSRPDLRTIVTTHRHGDHWQALGALAGATGADTVAHPVDGPHLPVPPDHLVDHGDTVSVGHDSTLGAERPHLTEWRARGW